MRVRQWAPLTTLGLWVLGCAIAVGLTGQSIASLPQALLALALAIGIVAAVARARLQSGKDQGL